MRDTRKQSSHCATHLKKAALVKSMYTKTELFRATEISHRDQISMFLHHAQVPPFQQRIKSVKSRSSNIREKSKHFNDVRERAKPSKQTVSELSDRENDVEILISQNLKSQHEMIVAPNLIGKLHLTKKCPEKKQSTSNQVEDIREASFENRKMNSSNNYMTCPSHVYTFQKGLVSSREAQDMETLRPQPVLPPVIADRLLKCTEQKHYRLKLDRDEKKQFSSEYSTSSAGSGIKESLNQKVVTSKMFSAEDVIPVPHNKKAYFDFKGYIEYLCKERSWRKIIEKSACHSLFPNEYEARNTTSSTWLKPHFHPFLVSKMYAVNNTRSYLLVNPFTTRLSTFR